MCGIAGMLTFDHRPIDSNDVRRMLDAVRHRGPDDVGIHIDGELGLGCCRLSIIDPEGGHQPISNEAGTVTVVCNGEIYNHVEERRRLESLGHRFASHSDVEVIVHLYEEQGDRCVDRLRGMFAFALWDAERRRLLLGRDRLGIKPLYYARTTHGLVFASEQKAILAADVLPREMNPLALGDLLTYGFVLSPNTLLRGVEQMVPGSLLQCHGGAVTTQTYWDITFPRIGDFENARSEDGWADRLREKLREVIRLHMRSDVPLGAWLSPGIDSSSIVALMAQSQLNAIPTVTLAFDDPGYDEVRNQRTLLEYSEYRLAGRVVDCGRRSLNLLPDAVWHAEDPTVSGLEVTRHLLARASAQDVRVVLTGEGSDEIFGGYPWYRWDRLLRPISRLPLSVRRALFNVAPPRLRRPGVRRKLLAPAGMSLSRYRHLMSLSEAIACRSLLTGDVKRLLSEPEDTIGRLALPADFGRWHPLCQLQYLELKLRMPSMVVHTLDRGSMAHSVEARVPFLDHELVELAACIPPRLKMKRLQEKYILRRAMQSILPPDIVARRKRGLQSPVRHWLQPPLPEFARELLSVGALRRNGLFEPDSVARLLEQRTASGGYPASVLGVLVIQLWNEMFVGGRAPTDILVARFSKQAHTGC